MAIHELQATLNALGYLEDGEYYKSRDCLNAAKDIVRYLKRDDPTQKTIRLELLKTDIISNDLIPLIKTLKSKKENELFDIVLRLLVNLTQSAFNCFELKVPDNKEHYNIFIEIDTYLKSAKEAFGCCEFVQNITSKMNEIIGKNWEDRSEEEDLIVERILFLVRNILLIKSSDDELDNRLSTDLNSHDLLLLAFHKAGMLETIIRLVSSNAYVKYDVHLLEIVALLLKEQSPEELSQSYENEVNIMSKRSTIEKEKDNSELAKLQLRDSQMRKTNRMRLNPRHSRFMGTYVAVNVKSINDENRLIVHKKPSNMDDLIDDSSKKKMKKPKNKIVEDDDQQRKSVLFIRVILKKFCESFLKKAYNVFFRNLKDMILRKKLEDDEICYYYWLVQFLVEFNRNSDLEEQEKIENIKETFTLEFFHSIEVFIQRCKEMILVEKAARRQWAKRMHTALKCYKENLIHLFVLEKKIAYFNAEQRRNNMTQVSSNQKSGTNINRPSSLTGDTALENEMELVELAERLINGADEEPKSPPPPPDQQSTASKESLLNEQTTAQLDRLKNQIFYIQEFRELFISMLRDFDSTSMSKRFLKDLIEANHIFISMLEDHTKQNGELSVKSKKKVRKSNKKSKEKTKQNKKAETKEEKQARKKAESDYQARVGEQRAEFKTRVWEKYFAKVARLIQNEDELHVSDPASPLFDFVATSDTEFDAQRDAVVERIQRMLADNKPDDSVALFREARCMWPNERQLFGAAGTLEADEEFEVYKALFMKTLDVKRPPLPPPKETTNEDEEKDDEAPDKNNKADDEGIEMEENEVGEEDDNAVAARIARVEAGEEDEEGEADDDDDDGGRVVYVEESLNFDKFLFLYTHPHVLKSYILMLSDYARNADFVTRCCMAMFERIAYECHAPQCLYQLSLFQLINTMNKDPMSRCILTIDSNKHSHASANSNGAGTNVVIERDVFASTYTCEDMFAFFRKLIAKFKEQCQTNSILFVEVLFFKDKRILHELGEESNGYERLDSGANKNGTKRRIAWTEEERTELVDLFNKFSSSSSSGGGGGGEGDEDGQSAVEKETATETEQRDENSNSNNNDGEDDESSNTTTAKKTTTTITATEQKGDLVDMIMLHIKDGSRKRHDICNQLVNMGCAKSADEFKSGGAYSLGRKTLGRAGLWRDNDVSELLACFQLVKDEATQMDKPLDNYANKLVEMLHVKRSRKLIADKLVALGLIESRRALLGGADSKHVKKAAHQSMSEEDENENEDATDRENESDDAHASDTATKSHKSKKSKKSKHSQKESSEKSGKVKSKVPISNQDILNQITSFKSKETISSSDEVTSSSSSSSSSDDDQDKATARATTLPPKKSIRKLNDADLSDSDASVTTPFPDETNNALNKDDDDSGDEDKHNKDNSHDHRKRRAAKAAPKKTVRKLNDDSSDSDASESQAAPLANKKNKTSRKSLSSKNKNQMNSDNEDDDVIADDQLAVAVDVHDDDDDDDDDVPLGDLLSKVVQTKALTEKKKEAPSQQQTEVAARKKRKVRRNRRAVLDDRSSTSSAASDYAGVDQEINSKVASTNESSHPSSSTENEEHAKVNGNKKQQSKRQKLRLSSSDEN